MGAALFHIKRVGSMFPHALAGARAAGLALLTAVLLAACGSDDSASTPAATPAASRLVVDTGSAAPVAGGTLTLKATLLAADGTDMKGASFAWTSSDPSVATVVSASDKAPAASVISPVGIYATVQTIRAGTADITVTATLAGGGSASGITHLVVQAAAAKSYTLALTPATLAVTAGGAAQTVAVAVRRSDGVDGIADLTNWSWTTDDASFVATPAADGHSAQVASPASAVAAGAATLTACADAPSGGRLCANAALARALTPPSTYTVGGTVSGLASGKSLMLADTNGDTQVVNANGSFLLPTARLAATPYAVRVSGQPAGQTCTVANGAGTISTANVTNIAITCVQAQFVVVANHDDLTVSSYRVDPSSGALTAVPGSPFAFGAQVNDISFMSSGLIGYAVTQDTNAVVGFTLDPATGALALIPGAVTNVVLGTPQSVVVHPAGAWLHIGIANLGGVENHQINATTHKTFANNGTNSSSGTISGMTISADGNHLYTSNTAQNSIWEMNFNGGSGFDAGFRTSAVSGGSQPNATVLSPDGAFLYVPNKQSANVSVSRLDSTSGLILSQFSFATAPLPVDVALNSTGQIAYVLSNLTNAIEAYSMNANMSSSSLLSTVTVGSSGQRLRIEPNGKFLYTPSLNGTLYAFAIDGTSGALTPVPGSPFAAGNGNVSIAVVQPTP